MSESLPAKADDKKLPQTDASSQLVFLSRVIGFDSLTHQGQLFIHKDIAAEVAVIFDTLFQIKFPIEKIKPTVLYYWSDSSSMSDNNTSAFNYRNIHGSNRLSGHAYGKAIDINPMYNPYFYHELIMPANGCYDLNHIGSITGTSSVVKIFESLGWTWGGRWISVKDYQHFEKAKMK